MERLVADEREGRIIRHCISDDEGWEDENFGLHRNRNRNAHHVIYKTLHALAICDKQWASVRARKEYSS